MYPEYMMQDASEIVQYDTAGIPLYIREAKLSSYPDMQVLCHWHEDLEFDNQFALISFQARDFVESGTADEAFVEDILRRESISSFAFRPGILLIYSHIPARRTMGSVLFLKHRISWNSSC